MDDNLKIMGLVGGKVWRWLLGGQRETTLPQSETTALMDPFAFLPDFELFAAPSGKLTADYVDGIPV
jgi:hypothetical protein